jgi:hypothetical protein
MQGRSGFRMRHKISRRNRQGGTGRTIRFAGGQLLCPNSSAQTPVPELKYRVGFSSGMPWNASRGGLTCSRAKREKSFLLRVPLDRCAGASNPCLSTCFLACPRSRETSRDRSAIRGRNTWIRYPSSGRENLT